MTLKADLHWLHGFPVSCQDGVVSWQTWCVAEQGFADPIAIDSRRIARAQQKLAWCQRSFFADNQTEFELPGYHRNWPEQAQRVLAMLADSLENSSAERDAACDLIHGTQRLESSLPPDSLLGSSSGFDLLNADQEMRSDEEQRLLHAVAWADATCPRNRSRLSLFCQHTSWLTRLVQHDPTGGFPAALCLIDMMLEDGSSPWLWLPRVLQCPDVFDVPTAGLGTYTKSLKEWRGVSGGPVPEPPQTTLADCLIDFIRHLFACQPVHRRRALKLVPHVLHDGSLSLNRRQWMVIQQQVRPLLMTIRQQDRYWSEDESKAWHELVDQELGQIDWSGLQMIPWTDLFSNLILLAEYARPQLWRSLRSVVKALDEAHGVRGPEHFDPCCLHLQTLLLRESAMRLSAGTNGRQLCQYLDAIARHVSRHASEPCLFRLWSSDSQRLANVCFNVYRGFPGLPDDQVPEGRWDNYLELALRASQDVEVNDFQWNALASLLRIFPDPNDAYRQLEHLRRLDLNEVYLEPEIEMAGILQSADYPFAGLVSALLKLETQHRHHAAEKRALQEQLIQAGWPDLFPRLLLRLDLALLNRLHGLRRTLHATTKCRLAPVQRPENAPLPDWASELPTALHPVVSQFAALVPNAERVISRIVHPCCSLTARTQQEVQALQLRLAANPSARNLQLRLENLCQRLDTPANVSPATIARLREKIEQKLERHVLRELIQRTQQMLIAEVERCSGVQDISRFLNHHRNLQLVEGLMVLEEPFRTMGFRLLRLQWNGEHWDRLNEPENQHFLNRLENRGVRTAPWLCSETLITTQYKGRTIRIGFECDVVEILLMGHYFDTCLSPDGFNFFSAVANAVDVNKRILFARDHHGQVVGRCLLALGDSGMLMTYHPYCHDNEFPMDQYVAEIAADLATRMGTVVSQDDTVSSLVAPRWYDDCARDLGRSVTSPGAPLVRALLSANEENVVEILESCFAPFGINGTLLTVVLRMSVFDECPALIRPLIPKLLILESQLSPEILLRCAVLASRCGAGDFAERILRRYSYDYLTSNIRRCGTLNGNHLELLTLLTATDASLALRILRATRSRDIRNDLEETSPARLRCLSSAHTALGRPILAQTLLQKAESQ